MRLDPPQPWRAGAVALRMLEPGDAEPYAAAFREDPEMGELWGIEHDPDEAAVRATVAIAAARWASGSRPRIVGADWPAEASRSRSTGHSASWGSSGSR